MNHELLYQCENDDCPRPEEVELLPVPRGKDAECPYCGWLMTAAS